MTVTAPPSGPPQTDHAAAPPRTPQAGTPARSATAPPRGGTRWVDASPGSQALSLLLAMLSGVLLFLLINLVLVSQIQHYTSQKSLYNELRLTLAEGATPVQPTTRAGTLVTPGTPVAVLHDSAIGLANEVIVEGTAPAQTMLGIGHERDTVLPCQVGTSALMARSGAYGAVGAAWATLKPGDQFTVTMGQGSCTYRVADRRLAGQKAPAAPTGKEGLITLTTATGARFMPTGVLRIDARLTTDAYPRPGISFPSWALSAAEQPMGVDTSTLGWSIALSIELIAAIAIGGTWLWRRWGRWQTWIVVTPVGVTVGLIAATSLNNVLPNLL